MTFDIERFQSTMDLHRSIEENRRETFGHADIMFDRLMKEIAAFEDELDNEHEIGGMLASFGRQVVIRIEHVSYRNPYLIMFHGTLESTGDRVTLAQHTYQLNVLFVALKKPDDEAEPRRIGFEG